MPQHEQMSAHTPLDVLKAARELLSDPAKWTQGENARDFIGREVPPTSPDARCFCAVGAVIRFCPSADHELDHPVWCALSDTLIADVGYKNIPRFNDAGMRTHAEVLDLFDKTIARLEAEGR